MQLNVIGEVIRRDEGSPPVCRHGLPRLGAVHAGLAPANDHKPTWRNASAFELGGIADMHDYDRLAESLGGALGTDGFPEHIAVDASSVESNNSDWMDQMTEHLVKDSPTPDTGRSFAACPPRSIADQPQPLLASSLSTGDPELDEQVKASMNYWLHPELPDENVMLASRHWAVLNKIMPAYCRFVQLGNNINKGLKAKYEVSKLCQCLFSYSRICNSKPLSEVWFRNVVFGDFVPHLQWQ
jgi:hypothetical protein